MSDVIALLANKTFLMHKTDDGKWEHFLPVTKIPQLGGEPEKVDVTRMCDGKKRYINGLPDAAALTFSANYTPEGYKKLNALATADTVETYRLCFTDMLGTDGAFEWSGRLSVYITESESGGTRGMGFTISDEGAKELSEVESLTADDLTDEAKAEMGL